MFIDHFEQVVDFVFGNRHFVRIALIFTVCGADDGEAFQVRDREDDALIFILQNERVFALVQSRHDQVAALNQANAVRGVEFQVITNEFGNPGPGSVDQRFGANGKQTAVGAFHVHVPQALATAGVDAARLGMNVRAVFARGHGVEHHQASVVDPAIGVFETAGYRRV